MSYRLCVDVGGTFTDLLLHGTTVATNAVLEGKGARVGLVVTDGYRQIMQIARSFVPGGLAGWILWPKPEPMAKLEDTVENKGRNLGRRRMGRSVKARSRSGRQGSGAGTGDGRGGEKLRRHSDREGTVDSAATEALREGMRSERDEANQIFTFGPDIESLRAVCLAETGLPAPQQPVWPARLAAE